MYLYALTPQTTTTDRSSVHSNQPDFILNLYHIRAKRKTGGGAYILILYDALRTEFIYGTHRIAYDDRLCTFHQLSS